MGNKNYLTDYEFDLMFDDELDALDLDYQFEQYSKMEEAKESLAHHFWSQRVARNGMTYGHIEQLNQKMFDLEWKH